MYVSDIKPRPQPCHQPRPHLSPIPTPVLHNIICRMILHIYIYIYVCICSFLLQGACKELAVKTSRHICSKCSSLLVPLGSNCSSGTSSSSSTLLLHFSGKISEQSTIDKTRSSSRTQLSQGKETNKVLQAGHQEEGSGSFTWQPLS